MSKKIIVILEEEDVQKPGELNNVRNVGYIKINIQGISLNEGKLYFSKLLKKDRTAF